MNDSEEQRFDDRIRTNVTDIVPPPVEESLRSQLADFRRRLAAQPTIAPEGTRIWNRAATKWSFAVTCVLTIMLLVGTNLMLRPQPTFAEVTMALLGQKWVHARSVQDNSVTEFWYSPGRNISASRSERAVKFEDHRLQVYYSYNPEEKLLYRGPVVWNSPAGEFESLATLFKVLVQTGVPPEKPLAQFGFLGPNHDRLTVLEQRAEKVTEQDRTWLEYSITIKQPEFPEPVRILFRIDTATNLPRLCRLEGKHEGKAVVCESEFDYPEKGPADIYDLGVARTVTLVDRVPDGDLKRIVESLQAGRERMDNYRAVYVKQIEIEGQAWWRRWPEVFYRKGHSYRRDFVVTSPPDMGSIKQPAEDVDRRQWWLDRTKQFTFFPISVQIGPTAYTCDVKTATSPDGRTHREIGSVHRVVYGNLPKETIPSDYAMRPEFVCRPPMGIGDPHQEPFLDLHPANGPEGCILLSVGHTTKEGRVDNNGVGLPDGNRYWLDPRRDYIAMRWDMVMRDAAGQETVISSHIVEETARSPQGVWYATKVRLKNAVRDDKGKQFDQVDEIYVDFDAKLPDSLFEPPKLGRID